MSPRPPEPIKNSFFVCYSLVGLEDTKPHWLSELGIWGTPLSGRSLKSWDIGSKLFTLQGEARSCELLPRCLSLR